MKLVDAIANHEFSPEAELMFTILASNSPTDEGLLVVISAAAYLLCRDRSADEAKAEIGAILNHVSADLNSRKSKPALRVAGGRDV